MNIEPLKSYLQNKEDIKTELSKFLDDSVSKRIENTEYLDGGFLLNDILYFIKKNTHELEHIGKLYCFDENTLSIRQSQNRNVTLNSKEYYIFRKKKKKTKRQIMEEILYNL